MESADCDMSAMRCLGFAFRLVFFLAMLA
jgi:hypothetical protein